MLRLTLNFLLRNIKVPTGGRNSSVGSAWACCPQRCGFDPPLGTFSARRDFSLGVNMGSSSSSSAFDVMTVLNPQAGGC